MGTDETQFVQDLKWRVIEFFSQSKLAMRHPGENCSYVMDPMKFLKNKHANRDKAIEAFRSDVVPQVDCGCSHSEEWVVEKGRILLLRLQEFIMKWDQMRKRDIKRKAKAD